MPEIHEVQLQVMVKGDKEANLPVPDQALSRNYWRRTRIGIYALFVLCGQAAATLLARNYYDKGGTSKWLSTFMQFGGFPILLPCYCIFQSRTEIIHTITKPSPNYLFKVASVYIFFGLNTAVNGFLYSIGLLYLPVSTFSLITASQLAFNSFFSYFLNKQKFTPYIINSLVLLTISAILLVFQNDSQNPTGESKIKYVKGYICTVAGSAGYGLQFSLTHFALTRVVKREARTAILDMVKYPYIVATCATLVGLFASKEWTRLSREKEEYRLGEVSYVMNLVWTAICWQLFAIGSTGLVLETSSLFSNAVGIVGLPIVPVLAVVFFHDKLYGLKVIAMLLSIWGFVSFVYQHYLDERKPKNKSDEEQVNEVSRASFSGS